MCSSDLKDLIKQRRKLQDEWEIAEVASYKRAKDEEQKLLEERKKLNAESLKETLKRLELEEKLFYNKIGAERKAEQDAAAEREKERLAAEKAYLDKQAELDKEFASLAKDQRQKDLEDTIAKNKLKEENEKKNYANLRSQCYFKLAQYVNNNQIHLTDSDIESKNNLRQRNLKNNPAH